MPQVYHQTVDTVPDDRPIDVPDDRPIDVPDDRPIDVPDDRPIDIPDDRPIDIPDDRPIDVPDDRPIYVPDVGPTSRTPVSSGRVPIHLLNRDDASSSDQIPCGQSKIYFGII